MEYVNHVKLSKDEYYLVKTNTGCCPQSGAYLSKYQLVASEAACAAKCKAVPNCSSFLFGKGSSAGDCQIYASVCQDPSSCASVEWDRYDIMPYAFAFDFKFNNSDCQGASKGQSTDKGTSLSKAAC